MSNHVDESSSPDRPSSNDNLPDALSSREPSSSTEERSTRESSSLRSTLKQQPHLADRVNRFYPGVNNRYGGIDHSDLVIQNPETQLMHLQYAVQQSPGITSVVPDVTTIVAIIQYKPRNDESGQPRRCWDVFFGHGSEYNISVPFPADSTMTYTCGDMGAVVAAVTMIKLEGLGAPLLSQIYIATDSKTLAELFTGPGEREELHVADDIIDTVLEHCGRPEDPGSLGVNLWIVPSDVLQKLTTPPALPANPPSNPDHRLAWRTDRQ